MQPIKNIALFLDRDGVINQDYGYVYKPENFDFIDGIFNLVKYAYQQKYIIVVITNQSGIARGYYTEKQFNQLTDWMCQQFLAFGVPIEKVYYSPYHPTEGLGMYLKDDICRKPHPGMILQAQKELNLDLTRSVLVGDKVSDIQAGNFAGVGINLLFAEERPLVLEGLNYELVASLQDVMRYIQLFQPLE